MGSCLRILSLKIHGFATNEAILLQKGRIATNTYFTNRPSPEVGFVLKTITRPHIMGRSSKYAPPTHEAKYRYFATKGSKLLQVCISLERNTQKLRK